MAKVGRLLHLIKGANGIRTLMTTLVMALPDLFKIFLLHLIAIFIFSILGMSMFKNVKLRSGFDDVHNFQSFFKTFTILFQVNNCTIIITSKLQITNRDNTQEKKCFRNVGMSIQSNQICCKMLTFNCLALYGFLHTFDITLFSCYR